MTNKNILVVALIFPLILIIVFLIVNKNSEQKDNDLIIQKDVIVEQADNKVTTQKELIIEQPEDQKQLSQLQKIKEENQKIFYDGNATLSGKYRIYSPNERHSYFVTGGLLCFHPDSITRHLIPRDNDDIRAPWFCLNDQETAKKTFNLDVTEIFSDISIECIQGDAQILISNYIANIKKTTVFDTANLVELISKEKHINNCYEK